MKRKLFVGDVDAWFDDNATARTLMEDEPEYTGLYDHEGRPLVRARESIGFVRFK